MLNFFLILLTDMFIVFYIRDLQFTLHHLTPLRIIAKVLVSNKHFVVIVVFLFMHFHFTFNLNFKAI